MPGTKQICRHERAFTLVELLVSSAVTLVACGAVVALITLATRAYGRTERETPAFRTAVEAAEWLSRDLQDCVKIYAPDEAALQQGHTISERGLLVFAARTGRDTREARGYALRPDGGLFRLTCSPAADSEPAKWPVTHTRSVGRGLQVVRLWLLSGPGDARRIRLRVTGADGSPLQTEVTLPWEAWR